MDLRLAREGDEDAVSVRTFLRTAAEVTKTDGEELMVEIDRWSVLYDEAAEKDEPLEQQYCRQFGLSLPEMEARTEGFRQVVGITPPRLLELWQDAQAETQQRTWLLDLKVVPVLDPSPTSPVADVESRGP